MTTLYDLAVDYRSDCAKLFDLDLDARTVANTLEQMGGEFDAKLIATVMTAKNLRSLAEAKMEAAKGMIAKANAMNDRAKNIDSYAIGMMAFAGKEKVDCPEFTIRVRLNPPSVHIFTGARVPIEWMHPEKPAPEREPNKQLIKEALDAGQHLDFATIIRTQRLEAK
jgi:hypothetical protein